MQTYKQLNTWQAAMELVAEVYRFTNFFPSDEIYGLTSQIRRAAVSVSANIAEGHGRQYKKETMHFFYISRGSLFELDTLLAIALVTNRIDEEKLGPISQKIERVNQLINGYISYLKKSKNLK